MNLANQHGSEGVLSSAFQSEVDRYSSKQQGLRLVAFDFHKECGASRYNRLDPRANRQTCMLPFSTPHTLLSACVALETPCCTVLVTAGQFLPWQCACRSATPVKEKQPNGSSVRASHSIGIYAPQLAEDRVPEHQPRLPLQADPPVGPAQGRL